MDLIKIGLSAGGEISVQRSVWELSDGHSEEARFLVGSFCCLIGFGDFWKLLTSTLFFCMVNVSDGGRKGHYVLEQNKKAEWDLVPTVKL